MGRSERNTLIILLTGVLQLFSQLSFSALPILFLEAVKAAPLFPEFVGALANPLINVLLRGCGIPVAAILCGSANDRCFCKGGPGGQYGWFRLHFTGFAGYICCRGSSAKRRFARVGWGHFRHWRSYRLNVAISLTLDAARLLRQISKSRSGAQPLHGLILARISMEIV